MHRDQLPIAALAPWSKLNDVAFIDTSVQELGKSRGFGLLTNRALTSKDSFDIPTLLDVPHDLILSAEAIEEHVKVDQHFRELMEVTGGRVSIASFSSLGCGNFGREINIVDHLNSL